MSVFIESKMVSVVGLEMYKKITVMGKIQSGSLNVYRKMASSFCCYGENDGFNSFSVNGILGFSTI